MKIRKPFQEPIPGDLYDTWLTSDQRHREAPIFSIGKNLRSDGSHIKTLAFNRVSKQPKEKAQKDTVTIDMINCRERPDIPPGYLIGVVI